jgi:hypothetical protein
VEDQVMLGKYKSSKPNMIANELKAMKSFRLYEEIGILQADRCNCTVVLEQFKYKGKLNPCPKILQQRLKLMYRNSFPPLPSPKNKTGLSAVLQYKLTQYCSKSPHLYVLPKIHKPDISLRHIVNYVGSPCYVLAGFLHKILSNLTEKSESFVKNLGHFVQLLMSINHKTLYILISSDISLLTNVPDNQAVQVISGVLRQPSLGKFRYLYTLLL